MRQHTFESFTGELQKLAKHLNNRKVNDRLARKCREIVYRRVKAGYGVNKDNIPAEKTKQVKLKPLSKSYIAYREGKVAFFKTKDGRVVPLDLKGYARKNVGGKRSFETFAPKLGKYGRPRKSNATLTGEMMDSILLKTSVDGFQLIISSNSRKDDSGLTNKKVSEYYSEARPFFALTAGEIRILTKELESIVKEFIEENL